MPFPTDPNAPRTTPDAVDHTNDIVILGRYYPADVDMDAPDPYDVDAIADMNAAARDMVDSFTGDEWPNLGDVAADILADWFRVQ